MKRRSFLGAITASVTAAFMPKESIAEDNKKFPYKGYLVGVPEPVVKEQHESYFLIEDGFITLHTTKGAFVGDCINTDVFFDTLRVVESRPAFFGNRIGKNIDMRYSRICTLMPLKSPHKICNVQTITMANGKIKAFKKKYDYIKGDFIVAFASWKEGSN